MHALKGHVDTGYSCMMPAMIAQWRKIWSAEPHTTPSDAPFGPSISTLLPPSILPHVVSLGKCFTCLSVARRLGAPKHDVKKKNKKSRLPAQGCMQCAFPENSAAPLSALASCRCRPRGAARLGRRGRREHGRDAPRADGQLWRAPERGDAEHVLGAGPSSTTTILG